MEFDYRLIQYSKGHSGWFVMASSKDFSKLLKVLRQEKKNVVVAPTRIVRYASEQATLLVNYQGRGIDG